MLVLTFATVLRVLRVLRVVLCVLRVLRVVLCVCHVLAGHPVMDVVMVSSP
jgi:hypothetical protein